MITFNLTYWTLRLGFRFIYSINHIVCHLSSNSSVSSGQNQLLSIDGMFVCLGVELASLTPNMMHGTHVDCCRSLTADDNIMQASWLYIKLVIKHCAMKYWFRNPSFTIFFFWTLVDLCEFTLFRGLVPTMNCCCVTLTEARCVR